MYLHFTIPFKDYFCTLKFKEISFEWILPLILAYSFSFYLVTEINYKDVTDFSGLVINVLAILIGFSLTCLTVLVTSSNPNIEQLKVTPSKRKLGNKNINLHRLMLITFVFSIFMEIILMILNAVYLLIFKNGSSTFSPKVLLFINLFLLLNILFLTIRNITNLYFVFYRKEKSTLPVITS